MIYLLFEFFCREIINLASCLSSRSFVLSKSNKNFGGSKPVILYNLFGVSIDSPNKPQAFKITQN